MGHAQLVICPAGSGKVDDYNVVNILPLDLRKESSIRYILAQIDNCIQYGEAADVKIREFDPDEE